MQVIFELARMLVCWGVWIVTLGVTIKYRQSKIRGWNLFRLIFGALSLLVVSYTVSFITLSLSLTAGKDAFMTVFFSYLHYFLANLANSTFVVRYKRRSFGGHACSTRHAWMHTASVWAPSSRTLCPLPPRLLFAGCCFSHHYVVEY